jgi:hypothetical protein
MPIRALVSILILSGLLNCSAELVDFSGEWEGTASLVVDGVHQQTPLKLTLNQSGSDLEGTVVWGEYRRTITSGSTKGPEVEIESATSDDRLRFQALFRNDALEGRFWIQYARDPEPFPGTFLVARKP